MVISAFSPSSIWTFNNRTLTTTGPAITSNGTALTAVAGAASVDFAQASNFVSTSLLAVTTGPAATASMVIQMFDGTNTIQLAATAAAATSPAAFFGNTGSTVRFRILNNDATHAGSYMIESIFYQLS